MSRLGKLIFVATALAPCAWAYSVNLYSQNNISEARLWFAIGLGLWLICWLILEGSKRLHQRRPLVTKKIKLADKEILAFVLAYLLPLASTIHIGFKGDVLTAVYVYAVIALCVFHANAFTFNPLLALLGYHFYEIECDNNMTYLLLSRHTLTASELTLTVVQFDDYIFIDMGS